jgi:hypothetical protein
MSMMTPDRPWEAIDRFRNAYQRRQELYGRLMRADEEMREAEPDALKVFEFNGWPAKVAIGDDIVECHYDMTGDRTLTVVSPEDIPGVHSLKNPFPQPVEAEVSNF